jgi:hypothetical protein
MSTHNLLKAKSVRHGSEFQIEVNDYSYVREVKYQYMSFRKRFMVKDHEITYSARRINFLRRINHFKNNSSHRTSLYENFHRLSTEEQEEMFQQFLQQSKDISVLWDHVRRLSLPFSRSKSETLEVKAPSGTRGVGVTFANSFPKGSRRLSYADTDIYLVNQQAMGQFQALSTMELLTPKNSNKPTFQASSLTHNHSSTHLSSMERPIPENIFEPMPFSNIDIIRKAQHPSKVIVGGRTILNKYLNEIFESIQPTDWILPYVITVLLLFHAEDHKLRDSSVLYHPPSSRSASSASLCVDEAIQQDSIIEPSPQLTRQDSNTTTASSTPRSMDSPEIFLSPPSSLNTMKVKKKSPIDPSVPVFPISSAFPSYQYLSTVFISRQTLNSREPLFWIQCHLFLIDGFLFQCDQEQRYLVPVGFVFLDEHSVHWVEKIVKIRGDISSIFILLSSFSIDLYPFSFS